MFIQFDSYSVGGFTKSGREIGGERRNRQDADELFSLCRAQGAASVVLYGWNDDGCEELATWSL